MLQGKKGVKYGLQLPARPPPKQVRKPQASLSAFQEGSDDEDTIGQQIARQQVKISKDVKVASLHAKALDEDPSIFDYDSHFDAMQEQKVRPAMQEKIERKSRYIEALKDKAVQREREQNVVYERRLAKERSAEDHLFGDKEKFVTSAYKKKLEEDKKWLAEEKVREAQEQRNDVVKKGHMGDFYRNILKSNDVRTGLKKPEQESSKRAAANEPAQLAAAAEAADVARAELVQAADMSTVNTNTQETSEPAAAAVGTGGSAHAAPSEWDIAKAARDRHTQQTGTPLAAPQSGEPSKAASDSQDQASGQAPSAAAPASLQVSKPEVEAVVEAPAQVSKEDRIAAAREKYLARKRQKTA
ncbi:hypothetical protein ABBQ32_010689 [Trebouxia sp. C0010 RCD-2024]